MLSKRNSALGWVLALTVVAVLAVTPGGAMAMLQNPSFESPDASGGDVSGTAYWGTFNQVYTTATNAHTGSQCLKTFGPFVPGGGTGATQLEYASPGQTWIGEIYALNWSADPIDNIDFGVYKIEFLNSNFQLAAGGLFGVDIFESNQINAATPQNVWTLLGVGTAPAPAGTVYVRAVIVKVDVDGAQGGSIFWDDASLSRPAGDAPDGPPSLSFDLRPSVPNPFFQATRIDFVLNQFEDVDLGIFDLGGRRIATLVRAQLAPGSHSVEWDGTMAIGNVAAPAGVYRCVMKTSAGKVSRNMTLIR